MRAGRLAIKYVFFELVPTFFLGLSVFVFIILMFQSFRLTEYVLVHEASLKAMAKILVFLSISFLPILLPMSLLFAVLLTFSRLSNDSEIVAFKSLGYNVFQLTLPAILLSLMAFGFAIYTSFFLGPWGNRKLEVLIHAIGQTKPEANLKEGVFAEGFFDLVVYVNKIDAKLGELNQVFIYDEREKSPVTIIAKSGKIIKEKSNRGETAFLRLRDGDVHTYNEDVYTKVHFGTYDIRLFNPFDVSVKQKSPLSYNFNDIVEELKKPNLDKKLAFSLNLEWHRRWALSSVCFIFGLLGVALGTRANKRMGRGSGMVVCIGLIVIYWILYALSENLAKNGQLPIAVSLWFPNVIFSVITFSRLRKITV